MSSMEERLESWNRALGAQVQQNQCAPKRSASVAGLGSAERRTTRKRAAKACRSCRSRKVRCSVSDHGAPCHNCQLDAVECIIPERKKPTRASKQERTPGMAITEAVLHIGDHSPAESCDSRSEGSCEKRITSSQSGWESGYGDSSNLFTRSTSWSPFLDSSPAPREASQACDNLPEKWKLPFCDEELARWFNVIPEGVVGKMLDYLCSVNRLGTLPLERSKPYDRTKPSLSANKQTQSDSDASEDSREDTPSRLLPLQESWQQASFLLAQDTAANEAQGVNGQQRSVDNLPLLQQLRENYAAAANNMRALGATLRKVDGQSNKPLRASGDSCNSVPNFLEIFGSKPPALTPPPEKKPEYSFNDSVNSQTMPRGSRVVGDDNDGCCKSRGGNDVPESMVTNMDDETFETPEGMQEVFDSLVNFCPGDPLFQSFDVG